MTKARLLLEADASVDMYARIELLLRSRTRPTDVGELFMREVLPMKNLNSYFYFVVGFVAAVWDHGYIPQGVPSEILSELDTDSIRNDFFDASDYEGFVSRTNSLLHLVSGPQSANLSDSAASVAESKGQGIPVEVGSAFCVKLGPNRFAAFAVTQHREDSPEKHYFRLVPFLDTTSSVEGCKELARAPKWLLETPRGLSSMRPAHIWCSLSSIMKKQRMLISIGSVDVSSDSLRSRDDYVGDRYGSFDSLLQTLNDLP